MFSKKNILITGAIVLVFFLAHYFLAIFIYNSLPILQSGRNKGEPIQYDLPQFLTSKESVTKPQYLLQKWDSNYYMQIVENGYDKEEFSYNKIHNWAFYPGYPLVVRYVSALFFDPALVKYDYIVFNIGLLLSNIFLFFALLSLKELLRFFKIEENHVIISLLLLLFPAGYFFHLFYTESLFLMLSVLFFLFLFKRSYFGAAFVLSLAIITRQTGFLLIPVFLFYVIGKERNNLKGIISNLFLQLSIIVTPILLFFWHLGTQTGNFLASFMIQKVFGYRSVFPGNLFIEYFNRAPAERWRHILSVLLILLIIGILIMWVRKSLQYKEENKLELYSLVIYCVLQVILLTVVNASYFRYANVNLPLFLLPFILYRSIRSATLMSVVSICVMLHVMFYIFFVTMLPFYGY